MTGTVLGERYELGALIGRGGMGGVYSAVDTKLGRLVAVKVFATGAAAGDARRLAEVTLLSRLNHPNLVVLHDAYLAEPDSTDPSFIVMELVDGPSLRTELERGPLKGNDVASLATELAEALVAVHDAGVVHRDIKPANILLAPTGLPSPPFRAKLADFGIAHLVGSDRLTTVGTVIGTAAYLSPEQAQGAEPGPAADIYSLGLVLIEALTGKQVYPGSLVESVAARLHTAPTVPASLPESWRALLREMTERDPGVRPTAIETAMRARENAPALAGWVPAADSDAAQDPTLVETAGLAATEPYVPFTEPTVPLMAAAPVATPTSVVAPSPVATTSPAPRKRAPRALWITVTVVAATLLAGFYLIPRPSGAPAPTPSHTISTPAPSAPAPQPTTVAPAATTAPVAPGNGNSGPGNGNGNGNGNGHGKGKK